MKTSDKYMVPAKEISCPGCGRVYGHHNTKVDTHSQECSSCVNKFGRTDPNYIDADEFIQEHLGYQPHGGDNKHWKIQHDPYMSDLYDKHGMETVTAAGFFLDSTTSPDDIDYMLDVLCTPLANAIENIKGSVNPCVLLSTGSFCPPHQGHIDMLKAARVVVENAGYNVIAGYISPGHDEYISQKTGEGAIPIWKRIAMCEKMCEKWMSVDPWEGIFNSHAIMFTHVIERLERYLEVHLERKVPVFFVCGSDNSKYVFSFADRGYCVVADRPDYDILVWPGVAAYENRIFRTKSNNTLSSTEVRKQSKVIIDKVNLSIRVEDVMFDKVGASYQGLLDIVAPEYKQVTINYLSDQRKEFENISKVGQILSLDALIPGNFNLRLSRYYDTFGAKMLRFEASPEYNQPLLDQIRLIGNSGLHDGFYIFDDDIHTTGGTIRYVSGLLGSMNLKSNGVISFKVSDDSQGEILDLRDFLIHGDNCGLVIQMPDKTAVRAPYIYPYVCPYARASVTDPMNFSIKVWQFNRDVYEGKSTKVSDLGTMGDLFVYTGMAEGYDTLVSEVCENHIRLLSKFKNK